MEEKILKLFLKNHSLKFNEIEKLLKTRSNKLNYHLKKLVSKNILEKQNSIYKLSKTSEYLIPYLSDKKAVLPVILIQIGNSKNCFLYKREKRPYKNKLSLPGGRMILGEDIKNSVKRIMKEKYNIDAKLKKINSISIEHIKSNKKTIHTFLLILITAITKDKIKLTNISRNKLKIIPSDYKLIKNDSDKSTTVKKIISKS